MTFKTLILHNYTEMDSPTYKHIANTCTACGDLDMQVYTDTNKLPFIIDFKSVKKSL